MTEQVRADWMDRDDQVWLGRWARAWATDPANGFLNPAKPNELDTQLLSLFDSIEQCGDDVDSKLEKLHETWKHSGLPIKTMYRVKFHYLFRGVGYEVAMRAGKLKTDSAEQTLLNWNRLQNVYDGQDGTYRAAEAWIGPASGPPGAGAPTVQTKPAMLGTHVKRGSYYVGGARVEGPLVDLAMGIAGMWRGWRSRRALVQAVPSLAADRLDNPDDGVVTDA